MKESNLRSDSSQVHGPLDLRQDTSMALEDFKEFRLFEPKFHDTPESTNGADNEYGCIARTNLVVSLSNWSGWIKLLITNAKHGLYPQSPFSSSRRVLA